MIWDFLTTLSRILSHIFTAMHKKKSKTKDSAWSWGWSQLLVLTSISNWVDEYKHQKSLCFFWHLIWFDFLFLDFHGLEIQGIGPYRTRACISRNQTYFRLWIEFYSNSMPSTTSWVGYDPNEWPMCSLIWTSVYYVTDSLN